MIYTWITKWDPLKYRASSWYRKYKAIIRHKLLVKKYKETGIWHHIAVWLSDFWDVVFPPEKIDKLIEDYEILEKNLDTITEFLPLPEYIWEFDGRYYEWFISRYENGIVSPKDLTDEIYLTNYWTKEFTKEDMLLLISLIKKKALEAKKKNKNLIFSGD